MLRAKNIYLSSLLEKDSKQLFTWINDREVVLSNNSYRPVHEKDHRKWFVDYLKRKDVYIFGIYKNLRKKLIGTCQLHTVDTVNRHAELVIRIGDMGERRKGYGTQAVELLLKFAFLDLNLNKVYLNVFRTNRIAFKTYRKAGFKKEGVVREFSFINGKYVDLILMGILRREYRKE